MYSKLLKHPRNQLCIVPLHLKYCRNSRTPSTWSFALGLCDKEASVGSLVPIVAAQCWHFSNNKGRVAHTNARAGLIFAVLQGCLFLDIPMN